MGACGGWLLQHKLEMVALVQEIGQKTSSKVLSAYIGFIVRVGWVCGFICIKRDNVGLQNYLFQKNVNIW